ncbi:hypothetical protein ACFLYX_04285 [Chloroflexota bacterium]
MNDDTLYLATTVDADSDFFDASLFPGESQAELRWQGIEEGIPLLINTLRGYRDSFGQVLRFTWFVRADNQLRDIYGGAADLLKIHKQLWQACLESGDEIGWHPHLYKKMGERWVQETRPAYIIEDLRQSYQAVMAEGFRPVSSRIGEAFQSNEIMNELANLGVKVDSTAMPGRARTDSERSFDWLATPPHPYYPAKTNYRVPGENEDRINILEVPMSMVETKVEYDRGPVMRYIDLSFHNSVIREGLSAYLKKNDYLVSITHPSTVLPLPDREHPLISFDIEEVERNLNTILAECSTLGKKIRFVTISEFRDIKG